MTPKVAVVQELRPAPFGTLASFMLERSIAARADLKLIQLKQETLMILRHPQDRRSIPSVPTSPKTSVLASVRPDSLIFRVI